MKVAIVDYGAGNVKSVEFALNRLGITPVLTNDEKELKSADKVIFPGVGHANFAMENLAKAGVIEVLKSLKQPVLGICLGMQLMCRHTEEGDVNGLGIFDTDVKRFPDSVGKVPHMGWNNVSFEDSMLFKGLSREDNVYYVHTFYAEVCDETSLTTSYGIPFSGALEKENYYGVQFHPEKSGEVGERILKNFIEL